MNGNIGIGTGVKMTSHSDIANKSSGPQAEIAPSIEKNLPGD